MTTAAPSFRPPYAVIAWADDVAVYVELPRKPIPYIMKFPLTEAGLSKALNVMRVRHRQEPTRYGNYKLPEPAVTRPTPKFSDATRETARAILKKQGLI